jgi:hypothetical protein
MSIEFLKDCKSVDTACLKYLSKCIGQPDHIACTNLLPTKEDFELLPKCKENFFKLVQKEIEKTVIHEKKILTLNSGKFPEGKLNELMIQAEESVGRKRIGNEKDIIESREFDDLCGILLATQLSNLKEKKVSNLEEKKVAETTKSELLQDLDQILVLDDHILKTYYQDHWKKFKLFDKLNRAPHLLIPYMQNGKLEISFNTIVEDGDDIIWKSPE